LVVIALIFLCGCETSRRNSESARFESPIATKEGAGLKQIFAASYNVVWSSALLSARNNGFFITNVIEADGFIEASTRKGAEQVGIWLRETGEEATEVEVYYRAAESNSERPHSRSQAILSVIADDLGFPR
jgi:hypothetical protein